ncbi:phosphatidylethanolamine N-methyltransferase /phosphatidyl-N-methylethanolamine N-methyltransferase [Stackebrandtia endophytica]|uniref:Phosphatidylethanolamine N-methyltransferase /phosphatidyl-N-methylethanolamine N-methyltransferase n=1 Tax=Stackebrandtia endophytica TaxID=1496996 RepID=A0A543B2B6_9ACTN|nr:class I SAM-dependent methyltransferase [Stackebrandtia endophytica]TQL78870.1 phosphatidylethanolamine N-methyltransferase /phosphatidyl-N-methylethanolamine N-methyltransferase [Stackebrandtia endophytica]
MDSEIDRNRRVWDRAAPRYDRAMRFFERRVFTGGREWVCSRAHGDVLEIGVGSGMNLPHYPAEVRLTGIDLSPQMLELARHRARELGREADLQVANALELPFDDASFDTVTSTLTLCAVPDDERALTEMRRVLRPGGRLLLLDHIGSSWPPIWLLQKTVELMTVRTAGEHQTRRPSTILPRLGFRVDERVRLKAGSVERVAATKVEGTP